MYKKQKFIVTSVVIFILGFCSNALAIDLAGKFGLTGKGAMGIPLGEFSDEKKLGGDIGYGFGVTGEYFISNQIAVGAHFDYHSFGLKSNDVDVKVSCKLTNFGAFVKHIIPTNSELHPYLKLNLGLYKPKISAKSGSLSESTFYDMKFGLAFGGGIFKASDFVVAGIEFLYHFAALKGAESSAPFDQFDCNLQYIQVNLAITLLIGGK